MCMNCMNSACGGCANKNNECTALGPFEAIEAACITTPPATGSIIPFASGTVPVALAAVAGGAIGTVSMVGFGTSIPGVTLTGTNIDLAGATTGMEAFSVPRAGTITSISATLSVTVAVATFTGTATVRAQIYRAPAGSNLFSPTDAFVDLAPALTSLVVGAITFGTRNVTPVPVAAGDRLLMVFSVTTSGAAALVTGNASAGINIV
ncbi:exosporium glycoprotein BclB-related protein [Lysinibacillus pakistanensis]|uniref:Exosporium glycoprotein BclB-related protein n=1 Tax=Lysinibacillus pakistanensis TaxID=759811 RepID=A0AAX3WY51_9BACI|nr:exosporium glycoprotein BclB-related protein [Lysinibacillus pakistanensis]MDM5230754.1 exosporium glycoprotein BclB-related protein [Lysinibacillus pakistanensis]WHY46325.1 exosporium glycoprotein BclB-related protein [Lysinibacillus pakistanensis]WHY51337.1 exosporium glycoprotein BclB-related protein [Lysinibacillus pakistanensis]